MTKRRTSVKISLVLAGIAHLVERHLAKVEVASSSLVARSKRKRHAAKRVFSFWNDSKFRRTRYLHPRAKRALKLEVRQGSCKWPKAICGMPGSEFEPRCPLRLRNFLFGTNSRLVAGILSRTGNFFASNRDPRNWARGWGPSIGRRSPQLRKYRFPQIETEHPGRMSCFLSAGELAASTRARSAH